MRRFVVIFLLLLAASLVLAEGDEAEREGEVAIYLAFGMGIGFVIGALSTYAYFLRSRLESK